MKLDGIARKDFAPIFILILGFIWLMYQSGMLALWIESEEYGHGLMVVGLLGYILYRCRDTLETPQAMAAWMSIPVAALALSAVVVGEASGISVVSMYGVWFFAIASIIVWGGVELFRKLIVPLLIVFLLIPLPQPLGPSLTAQLQLVSSKLGVEVIRLFGGVVYLEGNVIDMGETKLLIAEACAGLRYLFPLMSLGAIVGYILHAPAWIRWTVFLITIPITVLMNSFRIGLTGILTEKWGATHTEGFLHFFEGWVVFIFATLLLLLVTWLLLKLKPGPNNLFDALSLAFHGSAESVGGSATEVGEKKSPAAGFVWTLAIIITVASVMSAMLTSRQEILPDRQPLSNFPARLGEWDSQEYRLPVITESVAGASEYFYGDFSSPSEGVVNAYISFYETQRHGQIPHSPKVCIPGDGWTIESSRPVGIRQDSGGWFKANRLVIAKGDKKMLAYYWIKQGKKMYRQELLARMDLVRFSLMENRTDGALIRLVTELKPQESMDDADRRLDQFSQLLISVLPTYVPD